jgi:hypothetical protein
MWFLPSIFFVLRCGNYVLIVIPEWNPGMNTWAKTSKQDADAMLLSLIDMGYVIRHYDLRVRFPKEKMKEESFPIMGNTWRLTRELIPEFNENVFNGNKEANLWLQKN